MESELWLPGRGGGERRWPFRNQVLPTSVPARKNNLSSQTFPPSFQEGRDGPRGWEHLSALQLAKKNI